MTKPLDPTDELAGLAKAIWRADHDGADLPDDQVPSFEALARALDEPYMEDARADAVARLNELYRERTGREPEDVENDPEWHAAFRASIDAVYRDSCGREPPDDPDERAEATGEIVIAGRILALASTALRCADPPVGLDRHPLAPLVRSWHRRPIDATANMRPDRIMPAQMAMVAPTHGRVKRMLRLFSPAAHRRGQLVMPGFETAENDGPALPLALYSLGSDTPTRGGGRGAPLALRLFVEAVLAAPYVERDNGQPVALSVPLRELLQRLYPGPRIPRPNEYWPRLMRAVETLDTMDARIPWHDPTTGHGGNRRVVSVGDIPRRPGALDDVVRIVVDLPPGSGPGPIVPPTLATWGVRSAPAYNALLNLAYRWWDPGVTRNPISKGYGWAQTNDPERYQELSDADLVNVTRPAGGITRRRQLLAESWDTLRALEAAGELRIEGRRVMPPLPPRKDESPD